MFNLNSFSTVKFIDIILFFLINTLVVTIMRRHLTIRGIQLFTIFNNLILFSASLYYATFFVLRYREEYSSYKLNPNTWEGINCELLFKVNLLSFLFMFLVIVIGFATNIYILNYFKQEERCEEFIILINWFIISMLILLLANNFFTIIVGWELIGLSSFLLINFWRAKITTLGCSFKAFVFNKVSDIFLMIGFCILWNTFKTSNVDTLLMLISNNPTNNLYATWCAGLCILIASCIKSAQFIGHLWLPDSMEAPVPASALIHSATLVSAGIYLLLKFYNIYVVTDLLNFIFFLGSFTACFGGIVAASQTDLKKILAYSTISHCGFIMASLIFHNIVVTIVYLYLHGLFKALTFFCAGSIIKFNNTQDTRSMGMNKNQLFNTVSLIFSSINLGGLPFTFGYLYKFLFLQYLIVQPISLVSFGLNIIGMLVSVIYVYKLVYYSCFDYRKGTYLQFNVYLQNININIKSKFFTFSWVNTVAFTILYTTAITFYFSIKLYFLNNFVFFYYGGVINVANYKYITSLINSRLYLISLFYILFTNTILYLILWQNRENYFILEKLQVIVIILTIFGYHKIYSEFLFFDIQDLVHRIHEQLNKLSICNLSSGVVSAATLCVDLALDLFNNTYKNLLYVIEHLKYYYCWYQSYSYWYGNPIRVQLFYFVRYVFLKIPLVFDCIEHVLSYVAHVLFCFGYAIVKCTLHLFSIVFNSLFVKVFFYLENIFFSKTIVFDEIILQMFTWLLNFITNFNSVITAVVFEVCSVSSFFIKNTYNFFGNLIYYILWTYSFCCHFIVNFIPLMISNLIKILTYLVSFYPQTFTDVFFLKTYSYINFILNLIFS